MPLRSLAKRSEAQRAQDRAVRDRVLDTLRAGQALEPEEPS